MTIFWEKHSTRECIFCWVGGLVVGGTLFFVYTPVQRCPYTRATRGKPRSARKNLTCAPPKIVPLWSKFVGSVIWVFWLFCRQPVCSGVFCWLGGPSVLSIFVGFFCWKTSNIQFYHTGVSLFKILHKLILPDNIQFLLTILTKTKEYPYVFLKIYVSLNSFWEHGFEKNSKDTSWF